MSGEIVLQLHVNAKPVVWRRLLLLKKTSAWKRSAIPGQRECTVYLIEDNSNSYMVVYSVKFHLALIRTDARHILSSELSDLHTFRDKQLNRQQNNSLGLLPFSDRMGKNIEENSVKTRFPECQNKKKKKKIKGQISRYVFEILFILPMFVYLPILPFLSYLWRSQPQIISVQYVWCREIWVENWAPPVFCSTGMDWDKWTLWALWISLDPGNSVTRIMWGRVKLSGDLSWAHQVSKCYHLSKEHWEDTYLVLPPLPMSLSPKG